MKMSSIFFTENLDYNLYIFILYKSILICFFVQLIDSSQKIFIKKKMRQNRLYNKKEGGIIIFSFLLFSPWSLRLLPLFQRL